LGTWASLTEFLGYHTPSTKPVEHINDLGDRVPVILPSFGVRKASANVKLWDGQTVVLAGVTHSTTSQQMEQVPDAGSRPAGEPLFRREPATRTAKKKQLFVLITVTIVDSAGNRIHSDEDMPFAKNAIPIQNGP
jgi:type II secretory pathway component GspD/PulD (secretin)